MTSSLSAYSKQRDDNARNEISVLFNTSTYRLELGALGSHRDDALVLLV